MNRSIKDRIGNLSIYQMFLRALTNAGTLDAAKALLPSIAGMGFDIVYLCPIAEADSDANEEYFSERQKKSGTGNPKNPYRIGDYFKIDEEYGTDEDLKEFVTCAHSLGLSVMLDLVYFHCGPGAVFIEEHPDFVKRDENGEIIYGKWHFPEINFDSTELREYLYSNMEYFVKEFDIDGYRCDVGDNCPLSFWREGFARLDRIKKGLLYLNEGVKYEYLDGVFDLCYSFKWGKTMQRVFMNGESAALLAEVYKENVLRFPEKGLYIRNIENHDLANDAYDDRFEKVVGYKGTEAALCINYMLDGVPMIYNGCEVCDKNRHSIFANRFYPGNMTVEWAGALTPEGKVRRTFLTELNRIRHGLPVIEDGKTVWLENSSPDAVVTFLRSGKRKWFFAVNTKPKPVSIDIGNDKKSKHEEIMVARDSYERDGKLYMAPYGIYIKEIDR